MAAAAGFDRKVHVEALRVEAEHLKARPDTEATQRRRKEVAAELSKYGREPARTGGIEKA